MAFDGIMLRSICAELNEKLAGGKVDKITQPERDEINIRFRAFDKANKCNVNRTLLLSSNPSQARIHLTQTKKENPPVAPNFCMLLRKRLTGAKFIGASQPGLERVLHLDFECSTELYETVTNRLTIEIMGRCSNIVFTDENGKIYDAVHQVDFSSSEKRQILPGLTYTLPPSQDKEDLLSADIKSTLERERAGRIDKRICEKFLGVAPLLGREAAFSCKGATDADIASLSDGEFEKLADFLLELRSNIENKRFSPVFLYSDKPLEYYCFDIEQYGSAAKKISEINASEAVERYFSVKAAAEHIKRSSSDMTKLIATVISRLSRMVEAQRGALKECEKADIFKRYGDIITSNMYLLKGGEKRLALWIIMRKSRRNAPWNSIRDFPPPQTRRNTINFTKKRKQRKKCWRSRFPKRFRRSNTSNPFAVLLKMRIQLRNSDKYAENCPNRDMQNSEESKNFKNRKKPRHASLPNTSPPTVLLFLWAKTISKTTL